MPLEECIKILEERNQNLEGNVIQDSNDLSRETIEQIVIEFKTQRMFDLQNEVQIKPLAKGFNPENDPETFTLVMDYLQCNHIDKIIQIREEFTKQKQPSLINQEVELANKFPKIKRNRIKEALEVIVDPTFLLIILKVCFPDAMNE
jgi:hypothetical protein